MRIWNLNDFSGDSLGKVDPDEFKRLAQEGKSVSQIAKHFGVHNQTVRYWEKKLNLKLKRIYPRQKVDPEKFKELYLKGLRIREIADYFGISKRVVYYWRAKLDLPLRRGLTSARRTKIDHDLFKELYLKGYEYKGLARMFGSTVAYMRYLRYLMKLPPRRRRLIAKTIVLKAIEEEGFISKHDLMEKLHLSRQAVERHARFLISKGLIGKVRLGAGKRSNLLSRTLFRAGLSNKIYYYTNADKFARFLAEKLIMNLEDHSDFSNKLRNLKLSLRNILPNEVYQLIKLYL